MQRPGIDNSGIGVNRVATVSKSGRPATFIPQQNRATIGTTGRTTKGNGFVGLRHAAGGSQLGSRLCPSMPDRNGAQPGNQEPYIKEEVVDHDYGCGRPPSLSTMPPINDFDQFPHLSEYEQRERVRRRKEAMVHNMSEYYNKTAQTTLRHCTDSIKSAEVMDNSPVENQLINVIAEFLKPAITKIREIDGGKKQEAETHYAMLEASRKILEKADQFESSRYSTKIEPMVKLTRGFATFAELFTKMCATYSESSTDALINEPILDEILATEGVPESEFLQNGESNWNEHRMNDMMRRADTWQAPTTSKQMTQNQMPSSAICPYCKEEHANEQQLMDHLKAIHRPKWKLYAKFGCKWTPHCDFRVCKKKELEEHAKTCHDELYKSWINRGRMNIQGSSCPFCGKNVYNVLLLNEHIEEFHMHAACNAYQRVLPYIGCGSCTFSAFSAHEVFLHWREKKDRCTGPLVLRKLMRPNAIRHQISTPRKRVLIRPPVIQHKAMKIVPYSRPLPTTTVYGNAGQIGFQLRRDSPETSLMGSSLCLQDQHPSDSLMNRSLYEEANQDPIGCPILEEIIEDGGDDGLGLRDGLDD